MNRDYSNGGPASHGLSLLWPDQDSGKFKKYIRQLNPNCVADLDLERTIENFCLQPGDAGFINSIVQEFTENPEVIRYRQDVLEDCLRFSSLSANLETLLPRISSLEQYKSVKGKGRLLFEVTWRLGELEIYTECIRELYSLFCRRGYEFSSYGFRHLAEYLIQVQADPLFQDLLEELPPLLRKIRNIAGVSVGINLNKHLQPTAAVLLTINTEKYEDFTPSVINRIFKRKETEKGSEFTGITPLHAMPEKLKTAAHGIYNEYKTVNPMLVPLFRDLSDLLEKVSRPIASALRRYMSIHTGYLGSLYRDMSFYLGAVKLINRMKKSGLPMCKPEIIPKEERLCRIKDSYNINLALRLSKTEPVLSRIIVKNDIEFNQEGRIFILTGPNRGGKTTYMQSVGLIHVLAQAGLYVPATEALISPADDIFTHFPVKEKPELDAGRLGEEAGRLSHIFTQATPYSLILLNESLSNTSPSESLHLARDVVRASRVLGARAIYTTHLHELGADTEKINAENENLPIASRLISMVSLSAERTYRIVPGPPTGLSYSRQIALRHGISYEQLLKKLETRGVVQIKKT